MAIRLEKSGGLILVRGNQEDRKAPGWWSRNHRELGLWVALAALLMAALFVPAEALSWEAVDHALTALLHALR